MRAGGIVGPTMAGLILAPFMSPYSQWKRMDALSPWYRNNRKSDGFEMQRRVRKKSL